MTNRDNDTDDGDSQETFSDNRYCDDEPLAIQDPATGGQLAFCDPECLSELTSLVMPEAPSLAWRQPLPDVASCVHCAWCGRLVNAPQRCLLHEDACPSDNWLLTLQGLGAQATLAGDVSDDLLPGVLAALEHIGRAHPEFDGATLVRWVFGSDQ